MNSSRLLILVTLIQILASSSCQKINEPCNNGKGVCSVLSACPAVENDYVQLYTIGKLIFCDLATSLICCPKPKPTAPTPTIDDRSEIFLRKCLEYRNEVFKSCNSQGLIISGKKAEPMEFPHTALIGTKGHDKDSVRWFCGGTLISSKYVVSAAHCFYDTEIPNTVRLGELDYNSTSDDAQPQDFNIKAYVVYPAYNETEKYHDIVLVELDREATFNRYVAPACLPLRNGAEFNRFIATGWGTTKFGADTSSSHLLKVHLERFDDAECKELVEPNPDTFLMGLNERTQICAGSHVDNRDTCKGDSGGPLFVEHPDYPCMYLLVGVTSFGTVCGLANSPGIYTRVQLYVDWIEKVVWNAGTKI